ncbi:MAG: LPXTG cell wall anchor domain-containing protein, partial [Bacteroidia bacterium]|nr:LPXTG cell wall anchor domain-containing protein [Bacteroidia bacterium]
AMSDIVFSDFRSYDTDLLDVPVTLTNGSVTIMEASPGFNFKVEYIIMGLLALIILILLFRRRKK